jgi:hypothetical protein
MRIKRSQRMELIYIIGSSRTQSEELIYYYYKTASSLHSLFPPHNTPRSFIPDAL